MALGYLGLAGLVLYIGWIVIAITHDAIVFQGHVGFSSRTISHNLAVMFGLVAPYLSAVFLAYVFTGRVALKIEDIHD